MDKRKKDLVKKELLIIEEEGKLIQGDTLKQTAVKKMQHFGHRKICDEWAILDDDRKKITSSQAQTLNKEVTWEEFKRILN